jgi:hypothetical protein
MVSATALLTIVISKTPRKLKTAAIMIALLGEIDLVDTQVAIALGASVQPFTKITPIINTTVINKAGLERELRNSDKVIVINVPPGAYT